MTTATISLGNVTATQRRQEHFAQTSSGTIAYEQRPERALIERHGHEEWKQRLDEAWQGHLETLQQCVCELLVKNQRLRMAMMSADEPGQGPTDAGSI